MGKYNHSLNSAALALAEQGITRAEIARRLNMEKWQVKTAVEGSDTQGADPMTLIRMECHQANPDYLRALFRERERTLRARATAATSAAVG